MLRNTLRLTLNYSKIIPILHPHYHSKIAYILKNKQRGKYVCIHEIMRLIIMKMKVKMKKRSHRYDRNRPRPNHEHKYSKYKKCLSKMMFLCIKKYLTNI